MAINTPFSNVSATAPRGPNPALADARRRALIAANAAKAPTAADFGAPEIQPPPPTASTNIWGPPTVQPPQPQSTQVTGGTAPVGQLSPNEVAYDSFGNIAAVGGKVPVTAPQVTGGTAPVSTSSLITGVATPPPAPQMPPPPVGQVTGGPAPVATSPFPTAQAPQQVYQENMGAGNVVQDYLSQLLSSDSPYIQNARRSGMEVAAQRGLLNSSIAAGNSQRSAIEAAQPILNEITNLHKQREQLGFTGEQNQKDRDQQITMARINDWAANNQFQREYNGQLSLIPITSVTGLNNSLMQAAIDNPEVFPPEIVSGLGEFFGTNLMSMLQQWFPSQYGGGG